VKVECIECGSVIAEMAADTNRKEFTKNKEAICEDCFGDIQ